MENKPKKRVTLNDVARKTGVSYQTISRVIHNHPYVAEDTRQAVLQAIEELGYRPNLTARSLVTNRSLTLGIISFGAAYYGPGQMMAQIERTAELNGYNLTFTSIDDITPDKIRRAVQKMCDYLVDGLIIIAPLLGITETNIAELCQPTPYVLIDTPGTLDAPSVSIDQEAGSRLATQHLIDLGHRHICEISGPLNWFDGLTRHSSWLDTLAAAGLKPGLSIEGDWTAASGYAATQKLLDTHKPFTALVVGNDQMALGALHALHERGLAVPGDISVVGFDDIPEAAFFEPPLTTIRQNFEQLGRKGVECLIRCIEAPDECIEQIVLPAELMVRHSSQPA